jgi:hypothetical protein
MRRSKPGWSPNVTPNFVILKGPNNVYTLIKVKIGKVKLK